MKKIGTVIENLYKTVVTTFLFPILLLLCFLAINSTCYMTSDISEATYYVSDSILLNILSTLLFIFLICLFKKSYFVKKVSTLLENNEKIFFFCKYALTLILICISLIWVFSTKFIPKDDQNSIFQTVYELKEDIFYQFEPNGGYIEMNPNQIGLVFLWHLCSFLFPSVDYFGFQILNAFALGFSYKLLADLAENFGVSRIGQLSVLIFGILFFPLIMYSSFVYGNLLGLMFSLLAIKYELSFFARHKKSDAFISAFAIMIAIMIKNNYLITMIAMLIYAVIKLFNQPIKKMLLLPVLVLLCYLAQAVVPKAYFEHYTGYQLDEGKSAWSYVAMGLQDYGWFNHYNVSSYLESGGNTALQSEMAKQEVEKALTYFISHKRDAVEFFTKKIASQWNNPTFQGFWIVQVTESEKDLNNLWDKFISINGADRASAFLNIFQILILVGAVICLCFHSPKKEQDNSSILSLTFIGGFLFHLIWEAKCQYTITYFVLLFPMSIHGYEMLAEYITCKNKLIAKDHMSVIREEKRPNKFNRLWLILLSLLSIIIFFIFYSNGHGNYLKEDTSFYPNYVYIHNQSAVLEEGYYQLYTRDGQNHVAYSPDGACIGVMPADSDNLQQSIIWVETKNGVSTCSFNVQVAGTDQPWIIKIIDENVVCILYEPIPSKGLTYVTANGTVSLDLYGGVESQLWSIKKIENK